MSEQSEKEFEAFDALLQFFDFGVGGDGVGDGLLATPTPGGLDVVAVNQANDPFSVAETAFPGAEAVLAADLTDSFSGRETIAVLQLPDIAHIEESPFRVAKKRCFLVNLNAREGLNLFCFMTEPRCFHPAGLFRGRVPDCAYGMCLR